MLNTIFKGLFDTTGTSFLAVPAFLLCIVVSLFIGLFFSFMQSRSGHTSQSFLVTLALLPATVCVVIMMVNGNIGVGVAVAGAFSLIRFRSYPGTAKEITSLFLAMAAGMLTGMGYLAYAILFALILSVSMYLIERFLLRRKKQDKLHNILRITIPEDLNYNNVFDPVLQKFTSRYEMASVKTTNMGSLFKLNYNITLRSDADEKELIDALRLRNGNLEISLTRGEGVLNEL